MTAKEFFDLLINRFPLRLQEGYDNSGPQVIFADNELKRVLLALETDEVTINEAADLGCGAIVSHHPFFFKEAKCVSSENPAGRSLIGLIDRRISVLALHTNLDRIYFAKLAESAGFVHREILFAGAGDDASAGFGSLAAVKSPVKFIDILQMVKSGLKAETLLYCGDPDKIIETAALVNGAGGRMIPEIISSRKPGCIITGDVGYHDWRYAESSGVPVIDAGHYFTEKIFLSYLKSDIQDCLTLNRHVQDIELIISEREKPPFSVFQ